MGWRNECIQIKFVEGLWKKCDNIEIFTIIITKSDIFMV